MKKVLKIVTLTVVAAVMALLPKGNVLKAAAAPNTYYLTFDAASYDWYYQLNDEDSKIATSDSYYLNNGDKKIKDGDIVVVADNDGSVNAREIKIDAHLSNLTFLNSHAIVYANGIDDCFVLGSSSASVNADVTNGYVYDYSVCNFNKNVTNLRLKSSKENVVHASVAVVGTVSYASVENPEFLLNEYYNFEAGSFNFSHTALMTEEGKFSKTGTSPAEQSAPAENPAPAPSAAGNSSGNEYDDVPKTGDSNLIFLLLAAFVVCSVGSLYLRKKAN